MAETVRTVQLTRYNFGGLSLHPRPTTLAVLYCTEYESLGRDTLHAKRMKKARNERASDYYRLDEI